MSLSAFATSFLIGLSGLLGVQAVPHDASNGWNLTQKWTEVDGRTDLIAVNTRLMDDCRQAPEKVLTFPAVVHGAHAVFVDGIQVLTYGDMSFKNSHSFYGAPQMTCQSLLASKSAAGAGLVEWRVACYTPYFARFGSWPKLVERAAMQNFLPETLNIVCGGTLIVLILVTGVFFWGKMPVNLVGSLILANAIMAAYFIASTSSFFGIEASMLRLHKIADFGLWFGSAFLFNAFRMQGLFGLRSMIIYAVLVVMGSAVILTGETGDVIQLGTMIPFPAFFAILLMSLGTLLRQVVSTENRRRKVLELLSILSFTLVAFNDLMIVSGLREGGVMFSIGMICGIMFLTLGVNERVVEAYKERDYLRQNLEYEVEQKTRSLQEKTTELERTLATLKSTQAELIHSAKMASLGTLSAGIAHEINNALNYVNGALAPLTNLIKKSPEYDGKSKAQNLIGVMAKGLDLTFAIIRSLRSYTGLNQAKLKEHRVEDLISAVLTIIKSNIPETVKVTADIEPGLEFCVNAAGLNQVVMNLIVNAIDAMPGGGTITISGRSVGAQNEKVELIVADSGSGMPEPVLKRIFEPFFTTKDVGKGTGLGLHIVKSEIDRHGGELKVTSEMGQGTKFVMILPKIAVESAEPADGRVAREQVA